MPCCSDVLRILKLPEQAASPVHACSLNYDDPDSDGLYDLWGSFPELQAPNGAHGGPGEHHFPSLQALRSVPLWQGDVREVRAAHMKCALLLL